MITHNSNNMISGMRLVGVFSCFLLLATCFLASCSSTDEDFFYQDEPRVRLVGEDTWAAGTDSVTFSFVAYTSDVTEQEIWLMHRLWARYKAATGW